MDLARRICVSSGIQLRDSAGLSPASSAKALSGTHAKTLKLLMLRRKPTVFGTAMEVYHIKRLVQWAKRLGSQLSIASLRNLRLLDPPNHPTYNVTAQLG